MFNAVGAYFAQFHPAFTGQSCGYKAIAKEFDGPAETFCRRIWGTFQGHTGHLSGGKGLLHILTIDQEELCNHTQKVYTKGNNEPYL